MTKESYDQATLIYDLMTGSINLKELPPSQNLCITNEFENGSICDTAYANAYEAKNRICQKLGVEEDKDLESIIDNLLTISRHLSLKMYEYGNQSLLPSIK